MKLLFALASYLLGSIPTGYLFVRRSKGEPDIRKHGSRSTGASNVLRLKGLKVAIPVAVIDILKGFIPAFLGYRIFEDAAFAMFCGFLAVLGHCFPFAIGFRGGKGVATSLGAYAALIPWILLASGAVFILVVALSRYISLGSMVASLIIPLLVILFDKPLDFLLWSLATSSVVVFQHRGNIRRLLAGTERRLGERIS